MCHPVLGSPKEDIIIYLEPLNSTYQKITNSSSTGISTFLAGLAGVVPLVPDPLSPLPLLLPLGAIVGVIGLPIMGLGLGTGRVAGVAGVVVVAVVVGISRAWASLK